MFGGCFRGKRCLGFVSGERGVLGVVVLSCFDSCDLTVPMQ